MHKITNKFHVLAICFAAGLWAFSVSVPSFGQSYTASLEGIVTDPSGGVIPAAQVTVTNEATNVTRSAASDALGHYFFALLPPGSYKLDVQSKGFTAFSRTGIVLQVQQAARVDVQLKPGAVTTKVEVTGEAPRLDNVNPTQGRVVSNASLLDLPVSAQSRNPTAFAQLAPGVVPIGGYESGGGVYFSANGGRLVQTDILLDGVSTSVQQANAGIQGTQYTPTVESVQEFKIQTNSYGVEYGASGTTVINMATRSGTNQLHGDLFEFNQDDYGRAVNFFTNAQPTGHSPVLPRRVFNQFGGVLGGPVYIPKVYDGRNKTFFFVHHERYKIPGTPFPELDSVPTDLERTGDFSQSRNPDGTPVQIFDPATVCSTAAYPNPNNPTPCAVDPTTGATIYTRLPFAGNVIPPDRWNPVAKFLIPFYPSPTSDGVGPNHQNNFFAQGISTSSWYEQEIKIDQNFGEKQRLSVRYSRDYSIGQSSNLWGNCPSSAASLPYCGGGRGNFMYNGPNNGSNKLQNAVVDYTNTLTPSTVLNLRWGIMRQNQPSFIGGELPYFNEHDVGFQNPISMQTQRAPNFGVQNYDNLGPSIWTGGVNAESINSFIANLTKVKGKHTFKTGTDLRFVLLNFAQPPVNTVAFGFCNQETMSDAINPVPDQGNGLASFILGWGNPGCAENGGGQTFNLVSLEAARTYAFYAQDDFRVTPRLTLNLGLRYEIPFPATERHNRFNWIDLNAASPIQSGVTAFMAANPYPDPSNPTATWDTICPACSHLTGGYVYATPSQRAAHDTDFTDWGPRFGFAYQFRPHMVVRGGYGFFYGLNSGQTNFFLADGFVASTPWVPTVDGVHQAPGYTFTNPLPNGIVQATGSSLGLMQDVGNYAYAPIRDLTPSPRIQQWSLSVERELPGNSVVEIAYSGSKGNRLGYGQMRRWPSVIPVAALSLGAHLHDQIANPFSALVPPGSLLSNPTVDRYELLQAHPQYSFMSPYPGPPWGNSIYHSGYVKFTKRMSQGLQFDASYTFSKLISDSDTADEPNLDWIDGAIGVVSYVGGRALTQDWEHLGRSDRSLSIYDIPHRFVADFIYKLPIGRGQALGRNWNHALDIIAGGWQVNGFMTIASGVPLVPHFANPTFQPAGTRQRPNMTGQPVVNSGSVVSKLNNYLNLNAFSQPAPYTFGNAPRVLSDARAPGFHGADMSVFKQFYISREKQRYFEFRVEAFNVTNTPIFQAPGTYFGGNDPVTGKPFGGSDPSGRAFGVISAQSNSPRQIQLGAKLYF